MPFKPWRTRSVGKGASLAAKPANLSSNLRNHIVEGENRLLHCPLTFTCALYYMHIYTNTETHK